MLIFIFTGCSFTESKRAYYQDPETIEYQVEGENINSEETELAITVIENNLNYVNNEDLEGYLNTLVASARKQTQKELISFFENYDIENTLLSVEIITQDTDEMRIETEQQTIVYDVAEGAEEYVNHVAEVSYLLVRENDEWKIKEAITTNILFIEE